MTSTGTSPSNRSRISARVAALATTGRHPSHGAGHSGNLHRQAKAIAETGIRDPGGTDRGTRAPASMGRQEVRNSCALGSRLGLSGAAQVPILSRLRCHAGRYHTALGACTFRLAGLERLRGVPDPHASPPSPVSEAWDSNSD